jgi:hypothetical protein
MGTPYRLVLTLALTAAGATVAAAQPADTSAPTYDVTVGQALVTRARQLLDASFPADAKQLAEEALLRAPSGDVATEASAIIAEANRQLGVKDPTPPVDPVKDPVVIPPKDLDRPPVVDDPVAGGRFWMGVHGSLMGLAFGGSIGLALDVDPDTGDPGPAGVSIGAAAGGALGYFAGRWAASRWELDAAQASTIGSGSLLGATVVGLFADTLDVGGTTAREIAIGVAIGTVAGAAGGIMLARAERLSTGDVALMDSFAMYGVLGGLTLGAAMQPAEDEAYSLNAVIGGIAGWLAGAGLGPRIDASPKRVSRMVLGAAIGGGTPWLLYLAINDDSSTNDEQAIGLLSTAGILAGAYLGYRWSRGLAGSEVQPGGKRRVDPDLGGVGLIHRSRDGSWSLRPALPRRATVDDRRAWMLDVAGGTF